MTRAGSRCLSIFTHALNARILRAHAAGPLRRGELEAKLGWAPQSSLHVASRNLQEYSALAPVESVAGPADGSMFLTPAGHDLLPVADALEAWLSRAPGGPAQLDDEVGRGVVRVLLAGWDSAVVRALAERPLTLAELTSQVSGFSYPAMKRRLGRLRATKLVAPGVGAGPAYEPSDWLREAVVPLSLAGQWEQRHDAVAPPISAIEVEAAFLLALPLVRLPENASGSCACVVLLQPKAAGVGIEAKAGDLVSVHADAVDSPETWALGTPDAWFGATLRGDGDAVRIGGAKPRLAGSVVKSLGRAFSETLKPIEV